MRPRATFAALAFTMVVLAADIPAVAQGYGASHSPYRSDFRLRLGLATLDGNSEYWDDKKLDFTGDVEDLEDVAVGLDYRRRLGSRVAILLSGTSFEGRSTQEYLDFVDDRGASIRHRTILEMNSLELGLIFPLAGRQSPLVPYIGVGGGLYDYRLTESGDFIDFFPTVPEVFEETFQARGTTVGTFAVAGLDAHLGQDWSLYVEARWQDAEDQLEDDFDGFGSLDLSSQTLSAGLAWTF